MLERPKGLRGKERGSTRSRKQPLCAENNSDLCLEKGGKLKTWAGLAKSSWTCTKY